MSDVAERAGVSIKTVSNVINGYPYIRAETRERVETAIGALGYQVNLTARNLRQGRTGMIGLAVPELSLPYFAELADSVIQAAERVGLTVLIEQTGAVRERELAVLAGSRRAMTDGLLFSPLAILRDDLEPLLGAHPVVLLGERIFDASADHVTMANVEAAEAATAHLLGRGRRRVAAVGAHSGEVVGSAALRLQGWERAVRAAGLEPDPALVAEAGLWHRATGADAMRRLLDEGVEVDGVFAMNDALALGVLHVLHERRIRVPEDVAVIGFDDIDESAYVAPTLSTIAPGREQIARTAVDLLAQRIEHGPAAGPFRRVVADFTVVERESSAPHPG
ncbi:LacI family DNA-binding transcriptional regulator [Cellulomonas marina]|uniref:DNA-binding transcriptional regulator, LacI/PurR family n=1 Tax=Cellulomonas marina TaxID=988821 RepID=A0A1I0XK50_9CELL|nr:LacI family DNA-binding transcriptional regulator [Cellulomonas marina]GIG30725.1 LacI family transcriptional regulator [Cellulomonas marina]SFB00598.1 DNA-binding transcriptional regulator, LacI/PurR family [Cellulomonas marina]